MIEWNREKQKRQTEYIAISQLNVDRIELVKNRKKREDRRMKGYAGQRVKLRPKCHDNVRKQ